jgi:glycosyltransferase involved in cell wall biosynthesis
LGDGAEGIHIREMVKAFRKLGHEVTVAGPVGESQRTGKGQQGYLSRIKLLLPRIVFELLEVAYSAFCFVDLARKAKALNADFIFDRYITFNAGALWAARFCRIPFVLEVNAPLALERSNEADEKLYLKSFAHTLERYVCGNADMTLVVSTPLKSYLESIGVPKGKCVVMPNGVDQVKFQPRPKKSELIQKLGIPVDSVVVGFTGILRPWHGVEMLITAVEDLKKSGKSVYLLIVGDGPIWEKLDKKIQEAGLSECSKITGRIAHEQIADYVSLFDVAVSPKATFYSSPMKVVEYMSMGKAVVAPDSENLIDMIDDGENGILFEKDSIASLTDTLKILIDSAELRQQMGQNARTKVEKRLNWEWNAREVIKMVNAFVES